MPMSKDPEQLAHQQWLGYLQPVGLVVSIPALVAAQAYVNRNILPEHGKFLAALKHDDRGNLIPEIADFPTFAREVFDWQAGDLVGAAGGEPLPPELDVVIEGYDETLRATYAVRDPEPKDAASKDAAQPWLMLIQELPVGTPLDELLNSAASRWHATPQHRFERLLRERQVPIGLLLNGTHLRLVYYPRGESSGYLTFAIRELAEVAGRPMFAALHMLLHADRLFSLPEKQRLPAILADSRKYQNVVSTQLSEQVLAALYELVRGFQAADEQTKRQLLADVLAADPNHVYAGLLTVLMRLVFVLYAEDRNLLSADAVYSNYYSVVGLFDRLRTDAGRYPDTMDQRYGAWSQLLTLFRLIYDGGGHGPFRLPARNGHLFDPNRYPFLEDRPKSSQPTADERTLSAVPRVSDGVVFRVLSNLLILEGERLSYRTLDVEQIGSVYETMMGFNLEVASGRAIALKPKKPHGAPTAIDLDALLAVKPADRAKWLKEQADQALTGKSLDELKQAASAEDLLAALEKKIAKNATPNVVPRGSMVLQPSDERRRSGSHYTPRSLTEPIVRKTLEPVLKQLAEASVDLPTKNPLLYPVTVAADGRRIVAPYPEQILDLKVCDPAMGSGAFLVEACRQLGDELVRSWHAHRAVPKLPPDEDEVLHARRLVAQRCLYGVDKNPMAVDLAKLSLWLATLAKDHPFTFLDHSLKHGDSLVGLTREQIARFHWNIEGKPNLLRDQLEDQIERATEFRRRILTARDDAPYVDRENALAVAEEALDGVRLLGDELIAAWFNADKPAARDKLRAEYLQRIDRVKTGKGTSKDLAERLAITKALRAGPRGISPFHWEIEFPEVFGRENGGFDAIVGNPPFAGKNTLINGTREGYVDWLKTLHEESHGNADLVAHFFRRAYGMLNGIGSFGLIATNTIGQGDTRSTGLRWICTHGGTIYAARKRVRWPGQAAVVVSVVNVSRAAIDGPFSLNGRLVPTITAFLFHAGGHNDPEKLAANDGLSFQGSIVLGVGFTFDDTDSSGVASPLEKMHELIKKNKHNAERVFPYLGGEELNEHPELKPTRYIIDFFDRSLEQAEEWPDLLTIVRETVKPIRDPQNRKALRERWWQYAEKRPGLYSAVKNVKRVLVVAQTSKTRAFAFLPAGFVYDQKLVVFIFDRYTPFSVLQSRAHIDWSFFAGSTMKDDPVYTPTDCFETFPFPAALDTACPLETVGRQYYDFRAALMIKNDEGLTKTYNRFHDPDERSPEIAKLRELHAAMDRAVLEAYGWHDLAATATCEFLLDYEEEDDDEEAAQGSARRKKKPWRYRWPDEFRDEVLARLLDLNQKRAEQERLAGADAEPKKRAPKKKPAAAAPAKKSKTPKSQDPQSDLF